MVQAGFSSSAAFVDAPSRVLRRFSPTQLTTGNGD